MTMNEGRIYRAREAMSTAVGQLESSVRQTYHRMVDFLESLRPQNLGPEYAFATGPRSMSQKQAAGYLNAREDQFNAGISFMSRRNADDISPNYKRFMTQRKVMIAEAKNRKQEKADSETEKEKARLVMRLHDLKDASRPVPDDVRNRAVELGLEHLLPRF
ncbi:MAG: hypothetical protein V1866_00880 [archaeon]